MKIFKVVSSLSFNTAFHTVVAMPFECSIFVDTYISNSLRVINEIAVGRFDARI